MSKIKSYITIDNRTIKLRNMTSEEMLFKKSQDFLNSFDNNKYIFEDIIESYETIIEEKNKEIKSNEEEIKELKKEINSLKNICEN
jgi:peptidoglycan hydrolase CwlO-like protein